MANWAIANKTGNLFDSKSVSYHINNLFKADLLLMQNQGRSRWIKLNLGDCSSSFVPLIGLEEHSLSASERLLLSVITNSACIYARAGYGFNVPVSSVNNINNHLLGTKVTAERCLDSLLEQELLSLSEDGTCYSIAETVSDRYSHLLKVDLSDNAKSCLDSTEVSKDSDFCHAVEPASPCTTSNSLQSVDYPQERTDNTKTPHAPHVEASLSTPKHAESESKSFTLNLADSLLEILSTYRNSIQKNWSINNNVFKNEIKNGIKNNVEEKNFSASGGKIFRTQIFDELRNISANAHPRANAHHQSQQVSLVTDKQVSTLSQVTYDKDQYQKQCKELWADVEFMHELDQMSDAELETYRGFELIPPGYKSPKEKLIDSSANVASESHTDSNQPADSSASVASESNDDESSAEDTSVTTQQTTLTKPSSNNTEEKDPISLAMADPMYNGIPRENIKKIIELQQLALQAYSSYQQAEHALSPQRGIFSPDGINAPQPAKSPQVDSGRFSDYQSINRIPFYMDYIDKDGGH